MVQSQSAKVRAHCHTSTSRIKTHSGIFPAEARTRIISFDLAIDFPSSRPSGRITSSRSLYRTTLLNGPFVSKLPLKSLLRLDQLHEVLPGAVGLAAEHAASKSPVTVQRYFSVFPVNNAPKIQGSYRKDVLYGQTMVPIKNRNLALLSFWMLAQVKYLVLKRLKIHHSYGTGAHIGT